jgi:hypothetical protein
MVDEGHPAAVVELRDDLVTEHRARVPRGELLDVGPAEPARDDAYEGARPVGLGDLFERGFSLRSDDHGAHRRSLGPHGRPGSRRRYTSPSAGL